MKKVCQKRKLKSIKGFILGLFLITLFAVLFTSCGKKENTFTVGFDASFPPYGFKDGNGKYVGFDLDLAKEVARRRGWKFVAQPIDWDSKDMELSSGSIDCIWNGFTINGREGKYTWSKAYLNNAQVIVVKNDSDIKKLSDLSDKIVAVQSDSSALAAFTGADATEENIALEKKFKELQQLPDYNTAFLNLESGSVDAICMDSGVAGYEILQRGSEYRMLDNHISNEQYGIGFRLGNTQKRDEVQETLDDMNKDGTLEKIADKWGQSENICLGQDGTDDAYKKDAGKKPYHNTELKDATSGNASAGNSASGNTSSGISVQKKGFGDVIGQLSKGMLASLAIFLLTLIFSLPLGLLLNSIRMSRFKVLQWIARVYISIMRGTPLMLQLLVVFFGPHYLFGVEVSSTFRFYAVIIGFSLNYAAYFAEIFRAGIESIPEGQHEASMILGYSRTQKYWRIIFPQMLKRVIPPVTNEVITLVKDTSLAFALAYTEMFTIAKQTAAAEASIMPLFVAGLFYYIFNFVVAVVMERIEKSMKFSV